MNLIITLKRYTNYVKKVHQPIYVFQEPVFIERILWITQFIPQWMILNEAITSGTRWRTIYPIRCNGDATSRGRASFSGKALVGFSLCSCQQKENNYFDYAVGNPHCYHRSRQAVVKGWASVGKLWLT